MDDTKTEIIKQICTGDWKAIPVTMGLKFLNEHQFTQIFVDAGKQIREFRRVMFYRGKERLRQELNKHEK